MGYRRQETEDKTQRQEMGPQKTGDRRRETEDGRQEMEDRKGRQET